MANQETVVFLNGQLIPESQASISIRDRGYLHGDAVFDATRTFNGTPFKLAEHVQRLYNSLRYVRIDPGMDPSEIEHWSREVSAPQLSSASGRPRHVGDAAHKQGRGLN